MHWSITNRVERHTTDPLSVVDRSTVHSTKRTVDMGTAVLINA